MTGIQGPETGDADKSEGIHTRADSQTQPLPLILHYHLFKNAGTSIDAVLRDNFGDRWMGHEFPAPGKGKGHSNAPDVKQFLEGHPALSALSSHTALLPVPTVRDRQILPILFIRHPIDRLRSAYAFERKQQADTFGARLAKETDLAGYLRTLLDRTGSRVARNFQTVRLAHNESPFAGPEIERARRALDSLPFIGLVEEFAQSLERLGQHLTGTFPDFSINSYRKNTTQAEGSTLASRLSDIRIEIGDGLYSELLESNADDLALFEVVATRYGFKPPRAGALSRNDRAAEATTTKPVPERRLPQ